MGVGGVRGSAIARREQVAVIVPEGADHVAGLLPAMEFADADDSPRVGKEHPLHDAQDLVPGGLGEVFVESVGLGADGVDVELGLEPGVSGEKLHKTALNRFGMAQRHGSGAIGTVFTCPIPLEHERRREGKGRCRDLGKGSDARHGGHEDIVPEEVFAGDVAAFMGEDASGLVGGNTAEKFLRNDDERVFDSRRICIRFSIPDNKNIWLLDAKNRCRLDHSLLELGEAAFRDKRSVSKQLYSADALLIGRCCLFYQDVNAHDVAYLVQEGLV